jgi:hypothetical protein
MATPEPGRLSRGEESTPVPESVAFKDRRGGLIAFGILVILIGCVSALFVPLMVVGALMLRSSAPASAADPRAVASAAVLYAALAVTFIWLGVGSIRARRWARTLLLILAWLWLVTGVVAMAMTALLLPEILAMPPPGVEPLPDAVRSLMMVVVLVVLVLILVVLPGVLVLFYQSRHVKATVEARDPVPRWTDRCPMPVLGLSLSLGLGVVSLVPMMVLYHSVVPVFGRLVTGLPGGALLVASMVILAYCTWATYRMKPAGWWVLTVSLVVVMASSALTFTRVDLIEMYRAMGYPEEQIAQLREMNLFTGSHLLWFMAITAVLMVGYLVWVKKYFHEGRT